MLKNAYFLEKTVKNCRSVGGFAPLPRVVTFTYYSNLVER